MSRTYYHLYNSPAEFFEHAKLATEASLYGHSYSLSILQACTESREGEFYGSWKKTLETFNNGQFQEEASLTDDIIQDICTTDFQEVKWRFMQQLTEGDAVDVERYLGGHERCWNGCRRVPRMRQAIRIYINFGGNCFRSSKELAVAGAVGVTFAEIMESMGIAAEIWAVHYSTRVDINGGSYVQMVKLKAQNEYSDIGLINFMLGNDGVFRNALFRHNLIDAAKNGCDCAYGLGHSESIDLDSLGLTAQERKTAIIVPQLFDVGRAKQWLVDVLGDPEKLHKLTYRDDNVI